MELSISEDGVSAELILRGRYDPSISYENVIDLLNDYKIVFGVNSSAIKKLIQEYKDDIKGEVIHRTLAAQGKSFVPGIDGRIDFLIQEAPPVTIDESGRADFRNIDKYHTVQENEVLAKKTPAAPGEAGIDVYGQTIEPPIPHDPILEHGQNVGFNSATNEYYAKTRGIFVRGKDRIDVSPVLEIPRDVGLESGNVFYDGHVKIGGNVERGSIVSAVGDVTVGGTAESGNITAGGSLIVRKGINTKQEQTIKVGGDITAVYMENAAAVAEGSIFVERSIIQSKLIAYGNITLTGPGSKLTGGDVIAYGNVSAAVIGNQNEIPTRVTVGLHSNNAEYYKLSLKELENVERELEKKQEQIDKIKIFVQRSRGNIPAGKKAEFRVIFKQYKDAQELKARVQAQVKEFVTGRYNREEVRLIAREVLHPGVEIHYRGYVEKIRAPMTKVVLRFKPGQEKPEIEAYKDEPRKRR